jgi:DUF4097 and DUF4098 domain-containing protein YvlB
MKMSHQWMILAIAPCMIVVASPADAATPFSGQFSADPKGAVRVSNVAGDITITSWDRSGVDVQGELGTGVERVDVSEDEGDIQIRVILKDRDWRDRNGWRDSEARLTIKVPVAAELEVSSVSGSINVSGSRGEQRLKSVSGDIRSVVTGPDVNATSVSGGVELSGSGKQAHVRATSVSGDVRLNRMGGEIEARSTSGSVDVETSDASDVRAGTVSGSLSVRGTVAKEADIDLNAVSGRVKVSAQAPAGFRYDLSSFSGSIRSCFGVDADSAERNRRGGGPGSRLSGELGDGKASIRARSHSGSVEICDR